MKRYVLPSLKMLIAIALTKIAFFPGDDKGPAADIQPGVSAATQTSTAVIGDIANTVSIKGQVVEDAAVNAPATLGGVVDSFAIEKGGYITQGAPLVYLKKVEPQQPKVTTDEEGNTTQTEVPDKVTWDTVYAPTTGTVSFNVIANQDTTVGMVIATVTPDTYSATGTISASQQYRLTSAPTSATLSVEGGPAPFSCSDLTIGTKPTTSTTTGQDGSTTTTTGDGTSVEVRCSVPSEQKVFAGLSVTIGIDAGSATGALLVPVTAVEGSVSTGIVWVVPDPADPATTEQRQVSLGINDGTNIQVTDGLTEGETILLFVPGKDIVRNGTPSSCEPDNSVCYDENGKEIR